MHKCRVMLESAGPLNVPSSEEWSLKNRHGDEYLIQIGFPRNWADYTPALDEPGIPIIYLTDGNSVFFTALDALHRRLSVDQPNFPTGIIVAISYPIPHSSKKVYDIPRRCRDLTPAAPGAKETEGGADELIGFIESCVKPLVRQRLDETRGVKVGKEALYGHSFGGLFCLHTLFTRPDMFDCFIASSPSIWWNGRYLLKEEAAFCENHENGDSDTRKPSLMLSVGELEEDPPRRRGEVDEQYEKRKRNHQGWRLVNNAREMGDILSSSGHFENFSSHVYEGEDHGTVVACSLGRGLTTFFEDWPFRI